MFNIHKTFTKYDLIYIADHISCDIVYSSDDNKDQIKRKLIDCIERNLSKDLPTNDLDIDTYRNLMVYLKKENPNKRLTSKEKDTIISLSKKIIHYCKNDFTLSLSYYDDEQSVIDDLYYIKRYGDILSVRKACELWNVQCNKIKFNPIISAKKQKSLDEKIKLKNLHSGLEIKKGLITLSFQ